MSASVSPLCLITGGGGLHFSVTLPLHTLISWSFWIVDECDFNTKLSWMLHCIHHTVTTLSFIFSSYNALFVTDPASGSGAEGRSVRLFCCLSSLWLKPDAGSSAEAYTSSVKLLSEKSLMEPYVVYLSISFIETLSAHQCLWQRALCGVAHRKDWVESVTPLHSLFQTEGLCWSFHHSPIEGIQL